MRPTLTIDRSFPGAKRKVVHSLKRVPTTDRFVPKRETEDCAESEMYPDFDYRPFVSKRETEGCAQFETRPDYRPLVARRETEGCAESEMRPPDFDYRPFVSRRETEGCAV